MEDHLYSNAADREYGEREWQPQYDNMGYQPELASRLQRSWPHHKKESLFSGDTYNNWDDMPPEGHTNIMNCKRLMIILGIILLGVGIAAGIVMAIYFSSKDEPPTQSSVIVSSFEGSIQLNEPYDPALKDMSSPQAQAKAKDFQNKMDNVYRNSEVADIYNGTKVTSFEKGSVIIKFTVIFVERTTTTTVIQGDSVKTVTTKTIQMTTIKTIITQAIQKEDFGSSAKLLTLENTEDKGTTVAPATPAPTAPVLTTLEPTTLDPATVALTTLEPTTVELATPPPSTPIPRTTVTLEVEDTTVLTATSTAASTPTQHPTASTGTGATPTSPAGATPNQTHTAATTEAAKPVTTTGPGSNQTAGPHTSPTTGPQTTPSGPHTSPTTGPQTKPSGPQTTPSGPHTSPTVGPSSNQTSGPQTKPSGPHTSPTTGPQTTPYVPSSNQTSGPQTTPSGPQTTPSGPQTTPSGPQTTPSGPQTTPSGPQTTPSGPQTTPSGPDTSNTTGPLTTPTVPHTTPEPAGLCDVGLSHCNTSSVSSSTRCIRSTWFCDNIVDCEDGSDEDYRCGPNHTRPDPKQNFPNGSELNCNFEGPGRTLCNYQVSNGSFTWNIQSGPTPSNSTGPDTDHSYQNPKGHYIFTESSYGNQLDNTSLVSDFVLTSTNTTNTLTFFYHMYGQNMGSLSVYLHLRTTGQMNRQLEWSQKGDHGNHWMKACITLPRETLLRVEFVASRGMQHTSDIAVDDIQYSQLPCQRLPCTFDDSMCGEVVSPTPSPDQYRWEVMRGEEAPQWVKEAGLTADHSMGTTAARYLMATSLSSKLSGGEKTVYHSPPFSTEHNASLSFRYFVNGARDGSKLYVKIRRHNSSSGSRPLGISESPAEFRVTLKDKELPSWEQGCLPVAAGGGDGGGGVEKFVAEFIAIHGSRPNSLIAIDDIVLLKSAKCNAVTDCEFGQELFCGFSIHGDDNYRWKLHSDITGDYIEATGENREELKSMLVSDTFLPPANSSLTVNYNMQGAMAFSINVLEQKNSGEQQVKTLWTGNSALKEGSFRPQPKIVLPEERGERREDVEPREIDWMKVCVPLPSGQPLAIQLMCQKKDLTNDSMALKHVKISTEGCRVGLMQANCSFREPNMCNYVIDCSINTQFKWQRRTGVSAEMFTGPQRDHTTNKTTGHFLITNSLKGRPGDEAKVTFPNIKVSSQSSFRFYYYMYGMDIEGLRVEIKGSKLWSQLGPKSQFWYLGCVDLPLDEDINIDVIATRGMRPMGDIAIDDVSVSPSPCPRQGISCDFEDEMMCGYTNLPVTDALVKVSEDNQWYRNNISLRELSIFKTTYINDHHLLTRKPSRIRTPQMQFSTPNCLQFSYFILMGKGTNITVSALYENSSKNDAQVFGINKFTWAEWRAGQMNLKSGKVTIEFSVEPYDQSMLDTFFAINNVTVLANSCPPVVCDNARLWMCQKGDVCIPNYKRCDRVADCMDASDEVNCSNFSKEIRLVDGIVTGDKGRLEILVKGSWGTAYGLQWQETNAQVACRQLGYTGFSQSVRFGKYHYGVGKLWKINCFGNESKIQDCNLDSIENNVPHVSDVGLICYNTVCESFKTPCPQRDRDNFTYCLYNDQFCDGDYDCPDGSDERNCSNCKPDEFYCKNKQCILQSEHCNGKVNCEDASDEINCVSKDSLGYVSVYHNGTMSPFCVAPSADSTTTDIFFNTVCMNTAQSKLSTQLPGQNVTQGVIATRDKSAESVFGPYKITPTSNCIQARIQCNIPECGKRASLRFQSNYVQFGTSSLPREYPWQALLLRDGQFICGATVFNDRWIITAEHCVVEKGVVYEVAVGITHKKKLASAPKYKVKAIVHHPDSVIIDGIPYSDIALLLLERSLTFGDSVQPVCLPSKVYTPQDDCYLTGWGRNENLIAQSHLQEAKVTVVASAECQKFYRIDPSIICFKHNYPNMPSCYGDSGGPLVCRNSYGRFELVGVVSFGYPLCTASNGTAAAFVNVLAMRGWIVDKTRCKMRCPGDDRCLSEPEICDGVSHCADSRDEGPPYCTPALSCKFGTAYRCGYKNVSFNQWYWSSVLYRTPETPSRPDSGGDDDTDEFMLASHGATRDKPSQMESPEFYNVSCISFLYIAYTNSSSTGVFLALKAKLKSAELVSVWNMSAAQKLPHWKLARVTLPPDTQAVLFEAYYTNPTNSSFITVDDVREQGQNCEQSCPADMYTCSNKECIKTSYWCNKMQDCSDGSDEQNCRETQG